MPIDTGELLLSLINCWNNFGSNYKIVLDFVELINQKDVAELCTLLSHLPQPQQICMNV